MRHLQFLSFARFGSIGKDAMLSTWTPARRNGQASAERPPSGGRPYH